MAKAGADVNKPDRNGLTCLDWAVYHISYEASKAIGEYLYSQGAKCRRETYPTDWEKNIGGDNSSTESDDD